MWNDINIKITGNHWHITRSAGAALLCSALTRRLSDLQPELEPLSETLCWIILAILFRNAAGRTGGQYRQEKEDVICWHNLKRSPASTLSLWVIALCLVTHWFFAAENALIAFLPTLTPLLLVYQNHLVWHDADATGASPPTSQVFFYLSNTVLGGSLVALFSILTLKSDWHIRASDALSLVPVAALLAVYIALEPRPRLSNKYYRFIPSFDLEDALLPLSIRVALVLVTVLGLETRALGYPVSSAYTLVVALTKALSWYFAIQTVCT